MTQNTWQYQGRQTHGEWGHGTAPQTAPPSRPGRENPPAPASLAERASYVAYGVVAYLTREMARQYELRMQHGMLDDFCKLLAVSPAASHLSDAAYCRHLLGDQIGLDATRSLRQAAAIIPHAPTLDDLERGTVALSDAVKSDGLPRFVRAMQAVANAGPVPPKPGPTVIQAQAAASALGAGAQIGEGIGWGAVAEGAAAVARTVAGAAAVVGGLPVAVGLGTLLYPSSTASDDDHPPRSEVFSKPPEDAKDRRGAKAPGKPGEEDGFKDPKSGEKWVKAKNGKYGWLDSKGKIWVPTGKGGLAHGGEHWDVQHPDGSYKNVRPKK